MTKIGNIQSATSSIDPSSICLMCICRVLLPPSFASHTAPAWWQTQMVLFAIAAVFFAVASLQSCKCHCCCLLFAVTAIVISRLIFLIIDFFVCYCSHISTAFAVAVTPLLLAKPWDCQCHYCCFHPVVNAIIIPAA